MLPVRARQITMMSKLWFEKYPDNCSQISIFPKDNPQFWHFKTVLEFLMRIIYGNINARTFPPRFLFKCPRIVSVFQ